MGREKTRLPDPHVAPLRKQIERWRRTRLKRSAMPDVLWRAAAEVARKHGVYAAARALGLSCSSLRTRTEGTAAMLQPGTGTAPQVTFVEVPPAMRLQ